MKLRTTNHKLPIETGRWENIPKVNRTCNICNSAAIADEFHFLFRCESLTYYRNAYLSKYTKNEINLATLKRLMNENKLKDLKNISKYIAKGFSLLN